MCTTLRNGGRVEKLVALREIAADAISEEKVLRIKHMILSHHGTYEFGSTRLPRLARSLGEASKELKAGAAAGTANES